MSRNKRPPKARQRQRGPNPSHKEGTQNGSGYPRYYCAQVSPACSNLGAPERAPKIKKLGGTWMGHCCVHITHALNELPPEARGTFIKDLGDYVRRQGQAVARRERDRAAKRGRS
jgi:hypothetical protein